MLAKLILSYDQKYMQRSFSQNENVHTFYYLPEKFQICPMIQNVKNQAFPGGCLHKIVQEFKL